MATTITQRKMQPGRVSSITWKWVASAAGAVSSASPDVISGVLVGVTFDPGTPAPTTLYDVTITDEAGVNVLAGALTGGYGVDLSATVTTHYAICTVNKESSAAVLGGRAVNDVLTLVVANAGDAAQGSVTLYYQ